MKSFLDAVQKEKVKGSLSDFFSEHKKDKKRKKDKKKVKAPEKRNQSILNLIGAS